LAPSSGSPKARLEEGKEEPGTGTGVRRQMEKRRRQGDLWD